MGQKVDPRGYRVGVINDWSSKWYADKKHYSDYLVEDHKIREYVKKKLYISGISKIEIERTPKFVKVNVYTAKPGLVIGKGGNLAESLKSEIEKMINNKCSISSRKHRRTTRKKNFIQTCYETMYAKSYESRCFRYKNFSIWKIRRSRHG